MADSPDDILRFDPADLAPGIASADELPAKLYFRIGEVAKLTGLKQHVLRYWETEFQSIAPKKMGSNHRMYRRRDVELILEIKHLLYEKRFTIEGARKHLEARPKPAAKGNKKTSSSMVASLAMPKLQSSLFLLQDQPKPAAGVSEELRAELRAILTFLSS